MTQITPPTRSDDSKFSWSRSGHFLTPDTYPRACFHFLTRAVRIARGDPAERFSRRWDQVDTGSVADLQLRVCCTAIVGHHKLRKVLRAPELCAPPFANTHDDLH